MPNFADSWRGTHHTREGKTIFEKGFVPADKSRVLKASDIDRALLWDVEVAEGVKASEYVKRLTEDQKTRIIEHVISNETRDRDGDVMHVAGVQLDNFKKNPQVLLCHDWQGMPIGKAVRVWREKKQLKSWTYFIPREIDETGRSENAFKLAKNGFLPATSVGFLPLKYEDHEEKDDDGESQRTGWDINEWELLEYSLVPIPANPEALAAAVGSKVLSKGEAETLTETFKAVVTKPEPEAVDGHEKIMEMAAIQQEMAAILAGARDTQAEILAEIRELRLDVKRAQLPKDPYRLTADATGVKPRSASTAAAVKALREAITRLEKRVTDKE